jgi:TM2 domain-containing membrane protein YozV/type II secretory pathway pseudopilin PulG
VEPNQDQNIPAKAADEKYCSSCGSVIKLLAEICPKCGVRQIQVAKINKTVLILLTLFLGGVGGHKFYLGKPIQGVLYLLFCWTFIPSLIALIELIIYAVTSEEALNAKYKNGGNTSAGVVIAVVAGVFGGIVLIGILAALAIPRFLGASEKAKISEWRPVLKQITTLEEAYKQEHNQYTSDLHAIGFDQPASFSKFEYYVEANDSTNFKAHAKLVTKVGDANIGDEVAVDKDFNVSTTGEISKYVSQ